MGDAADGDEGDGGVDGIAHAAQGVEAEGGVGVLLCAGVEDGAEGDVVERKMRGFDGLGDGVCGVADDEVCAEQAARGDGVEVVLAEMDAVCAEGEGDVGTVVDDEAHVRVRAHYVERGFRRIVKLARREMFFAQLDKGRAAR